VFVKALMQIKNLTHMKIPSIAFLLVLLFLSGCNLKNGKNRSSVAKGVNDSPKKTFWAGGVDGGQWYVIKKMDVIKEIVHFKIYNETSGDLLVNKEFKLNCAADVPLDWDHLEAVISGYDGEKILLSTTDKNKKNCFFE